MISIHVEGKNMQEIREHLAGLLGADGITVSAAVVSQYPPQEAADKPKRTAKAAEPAPVVQQTAPQPIAPAPAQAAPPAAAIAAAQAPAPTLEAVKAAIAAAQAPAPTLEAVKAAIQKVLAQRPNEPTAVEGMARARAIVKQIAGVERVKEIPVDKYAAVIAACEASK